MLICVFFKYFIAAIRLNGNTKNCTDSEIITFIKAWLVRSKDRFNNKQNKENNPKASADEAGQQRNVAENTIE